MQSYEIWIIVLGALVSASCGLLGCFLILKRLAMMGDAISHSVLPGIVIAVLLTGQIHSVWVLLAAGIMGLLTPFLTDFIKKSGLINEDAAIGAVFTTMFALGVILVSSMENIDLDVDCILYGEIATAPLDALIISGICFGPKSFWVLSVLFLVNAFFVFFFYKELKISSFDFALAESMNMHPQRVHYLLMSMISITIIVCFESVGSILVVAMLIVPGACAYLLTHRLGNMLILSVLFGILFSFSGYVITFAFEGNVSVSGSMASASGVIFLLVLLFSPSQGIISTLMKQYQNKRTIIKDHILLDLYRQEEKESPLDRKTFLSKYNYKNTKEQKILQNLIKNNMVLEKDNTVTLSSEGRIHAQKLMRSHRLWEMYMHSIGSKSDHVHRSASDMEHIMPSELCEEIDQILEHPVYDPHGKKIPRYHKFCGNLQNSSESVRQL